MSIPNTSSYMYLKTLLFFRCNLRGEKEEEEKDEGKEGEE